MRELETGQKSDDFKTTKHLRIVYAKSINEKEIEKVKLMIKRFRL